MRTLACALGNALEHNNLFLMPVWRAIGRSRVLVMAEYLPKTLLISGAILAGLLILTLVPKEFELKAEGTLQPVVRKDVFFAANGEVDKVLVKHGDTVKASQILVEAGRTTSCSRNVRRPPQRWKRRSRIWM